jgi:ribokinase
MPQAAIDVLGLGCVAVDDLLYLPAFPRPEEKVRIRTRQRQCGGLTATALVAAARLGARCAYAGVLGDDELSGFVRSTFEREGVDLTWLRTEPGARPIHSTILVDESARNRTVLFDLTGTVGAAIEHPPTDVITAAKVLYVDHYGIEGMTRAAMLARDAGIPIVADLERDEWPGFDGLLALVDHLILSEPFARRRTRTPDAASAVRALWTPGRQVVVVTCGEAGCWYMSDGIAIRHLPAFAVETVDPTGCGDVFHGAYAALLARGMPLEERLRAASAVAALKVGQPGAQAGAPTWAAVAAFLDTRNEMGPGL